LLCSTHAQQAQVTSTATYIGWRNFEKKSTEQGGQKDQRSELAARKLIVITLTN